MKGCSDRLRRRVVTEARRAGEGAVCGPRSRFGVPCLALLLVFGCSQRSQPRVYPDKPDSNAGQRAIELYDIDKHGFLTAKELEKLPGLKAAVRQIDLNNDGNISAAEISARIQAWSDSRLGRMGVSCIVKHNGRPLAGATVRLVPEPFLGGGLKTAEGTTDDHGLARMSVAGSGQRGISPGFYRVEIIKAGEAVPPRYNTETSLGQEVASDAAGLNNGVARFNLNY
jgi:hypothetical protein